MTLQTKLPIMTLDDEIGVTSYPMCVSVQGAEAPRVDIAEAQPLDSFPRAVQEHICEHPEHGVLC